MKILLHGLNYAPEEIGIGKYSGEMVRELARRGHEVTVVTTPPYYPDWKVWQGYRAASYRTETSLTSGNAPSVRVIRCPLWVPRKVTGAKRILHLLSFGLSSSPVVIWKAIQFRPDVVMTVEPAAVCMPTSWFAARLVGAKAWLHVQDFEVDAAFQLGILKHPLLKKLVQRVESIWMRRFDRVSSISPNMVQKLTEKGVDSDRAIAFPNWVDCSVMKPIDDSGKCRDRFGIPQDACVALYAGNIGAKQGLEIIVDAARQLREHPEIHFVVCGRGAAYEMLVQAAKGLENLQFLPVQPLECFNELMNCADIHLLPQKADAADLVMPSKLTGMLATGRPVVACAAADTQIAKVVAGNGLVVTPEDSFAFVDAIVKLVSDTELRIELGAAARRYAENHLGREAILSRFIGELRELINRPAVDPSIMAGTEPAVAGNHRIESPHPLGMPASEKNSQSEGVNSISHPTSI